MLYIMESLSPGEHIIQPTGYHWMYVFQKVIGFVFFVIAAMLIVILGSVYHSFPTLPPWRVMDAIHDMSWAELIRGFWSANLAFRLVAFALVMLGVVQFAIAMVVRATTEIAVTNRRLILKIGIIARNMNELKIENIEGIVVNQSIMGRIFNYGQMSAHGTGVGEIHFPDYMADPISFRRAIQSARTVVVAPDYNNVDQVSEPEGGVNHAQPNAAQPGNRQAPNAQAAHPQPTMAAAARPAKHPSNDENDLAAAVARHPRAADGSVDI